MTIYPLSHHTATLHIGSNAYDITSLSKDCIHLNDASTIPLNTTLSADIVIDEFQISNMALSAAQDETGLYLSPTSSTDEALLWNLMYQCCIRKGSHPTIPAKTDKLPKIPNRGQYSETAQQARLAFLHEQTGISLEQCGQHGFDLSTLVGNIESVIGSVEIPLGVAGPLLINGLQQNGLSYIPMATTEGTLVSSAMRGSTVITRSGGVTARVLSQKMMRVPLFIVNNIHAALFLSAWMKDHFDEIRSETLKYSNYANLLKIEPEIFGKSIHVRFIYETKDAAGQNMSTTCTWRACLWILEKIKDFPDCEIENFFIEANHSSDKKVSGRALVEGRGLKAVAECHIPYRQIRRFLKVDAKQLFKAYQGFVSGSVISGMLGVNINFANMIAAMFTACGQDIASVHESSIGYLMLELKEETETLYASVMLPNLVIGTVGGGTALPQQQECLSLIGCAGSDKVHKFAETIASACLALELSTLAAIASDQFALSHEKLGRNRPVNFLKLSSLDKAFFQPGFSRYFQDDKHQLVSAELLEDFSPGNSIITELTSHRINKLVGLFPFNIQFNQSDDLKVLVKTKPLDAEVLMMLNGIAAMCDPELALAYKNFKHKTSFISCHTKELAVMRQTDPRFVSHAPRVYQVYENPEREAYVLVEEFLENTELMDCVGDLSQWTKQHRHAALDGMAELHSIWYQREDELKAQPWIGRYPNKARRIDMLPLWQALGQNAFNDDEVMTWFNQSDFQLFQEILDDLPNWWTLLDSLPKTLIHNDFNPRNITFRKTEKGLQLCAYDWELATIHVPQYDLAEFLCFTLAPTVSAEEVNEYIQYFRRALEQSTQTIIDEEQWMLGFHYALQDFFINRLSMYFMVHLFRHYDFLERVFATLKRLLVLTRHSTNSIHHT